MFKRMLAAKRNRNFYFKLIGFTLVISLLPILMISMFIYYNVRHSLEAELHNANSNYLAQTANAIEIVISQISNSYEQFTKESTLRDFETFSQGNYYEKINSNIPDIDLPKLARYIFSKAKVRQSLDNLKISNDFIYSVYFIDRGKNITLTSVGAQIGEEEANKQAWIRVPEDETEFPYFSEVRMIKEWGGEFKQILPVIYKSPYMKNYVVVNLDVDIIYAKIIKKLGQQGQEEQSFFVLSNTETLLLYDGQSEMYQEIKKQFKDKPMVLGYHDQNMLITYKKSDVLKWTFISAVDLNGLYQSVSHIKGLIFITSFFLFIATALFSFMASRNIYHPIVRLLSYVKSVDSTNKQEHNGKPLDELNVIKIRFEEAIEDRNSLQVRLKESLPAYREKFLATLVKNNRYSREEMQERMAILDIDFQLDDIVLMNIYYEERNDMKMDFTSINIRKLRMQAYLEEELSLRYQGFVSEMSEDLLTIVINCQKKEMVEIFIFAEELKKQLQELFNIRCTIGIGRHYPDIFHAKQAFDEAEEAIRHRNIGGTGEVIYIDDVRLVNTPIFAYPKEKEVTLNNYIRNGEAGQAKLMFADFVKDLKVQKNQLHYHQIQQAFMQLLISLMETANHMRVDMTKNLGEENNLYTVLLQKKDLNGIIAWFEKIIMLISVYIDAAFKEKQSNYIHEVMRLVEESRGSELSLSFVAEKINLNPSYLSRIFKDKTGVNFQEYITSTRIEKSKKMLMETNLKVKDICEVLGYSNVNYFIRVFKEVTGTTPKEFRKFYSEPTG